MNSCTRWKWIGLAALLIQLAACSKHDVKPVAGAPTITFDTGEVKVKVGGTITLTAHIANADQAVFSWKMDGKIISTSINCPFPGTEVGEYFVTLRVDAENGSAEQQIKVDVVDKLPPQINMPNNLIAYQGKDNPIPATVAYAAGAKYSWKLNGVVVSSDSIYIFHPADRGSNVLTLLVVNSDGQDLKSFGLMVVPPPAPELFFDDGHYHIPGDATTKRMSIPLGKTLILAPVVSNIPSPAAFQWTIDGAAQSSSTVYLSFTPAAKGNYLVAVTAAGVTAKVNVECVDAEGAHFRAPVPASRTIATTAFEFVPAPGQFVAYDIGSTAAQATQDVQSQLDQNTTGWIESLGAYGGYMITGFDHSVADVPGVADLHIEGNEFTNWSEPGIVWVMQDENGNGLPDDTWYELKGSETGKPTATERYAITYFKPTGPGQDVLWVDNLGGSGSVDYNQYHSQPYYFPMFINSDSYTLTGTGLKSQVVIGDIVTSGGYPWGYVDNVGDGTHLDYWIENAIRADGTPANLKYIDFVKVHTGMSAKGPAVGEISTETSAPFDLNLKK